MAPDRPESEEPPRHVDFSFSCELAKSCAETNAYNLEEWARGLKIEIDWHEGPTAGPGLHHARVNVTGMPETASYADLSVLINFLNLDT